MTNIVKGLTEAIDSGDATLHHGLTKNCPTPTASGACPGHPITITATAEVERQRALIADLATALRRALSVIEGPPTMNPDRVPTALAIRSALARVEGGKP